MRDNPTLPLPDSLDLDFLNRIYGAVLSSAGGSPRNFLSVVAQTLGEFFGASVTTIWDNNVYTGKLVYIAGNPVRLCLDGPFVIPRQTSVTGLAIQKGEVVWSDLQREPPTGRIFYAPEMPGRHKLNHLVSIPISSAFNADFRVLVVNLYYQNEPKHLRKRKAEFDWTIRSLGIALDYLLLMEDEQIRHCVGEATRMATGVSGLFDAISDCLQEVTQCTGGSLFLISDDSAQLRLERQFCGKMISEMLPENRTNTSTLLAMEHCAKKRKPIIHHDGNNAQNNITEAIDKHTWMSVPVFSAADKVIGVLLCDNPRCASDPKASTSFSSLDLRALETFGKALSPSIDKFSHIRKGSILNKVVKEVSEAIATAHSLNDILMRTIRAAVESFNADVGSIYLMEDDGKTLTMQAAAGSNEHLIGKAQYDIGHGLTGTIALGETLNFKSNEEVETHPRWLGKFDKEIFGAQNGQARNFLGVPIVASNKVIGVWKISNTQSMSNHPDPYFTDEDVQAVEVLCSFLAYVVTTAGLKEATDRQFRFLARSTANIEQAVSEDDAITSVLAALEETGQSHSVFSRYDRDAGAIRGLIASDQAWQDAVSQTTVPIDSSHVLAEVLRSGSPRFLCSSDSITEAERVFLEKFDRVSQYVLPVRLDEELIGTLQVSNQGNDGKPSDDQELVLQAFAAHLSVVISRLRSINQSVDLTQHVMASARFIVAEAFSGAVIHSLSHRMDELLEKLDTELKKREIRDRKPLLTTFQTWKRVLTEFQKDVHQSLDLVRAAGAGAEFGPTNLNDQLQPTIDMWHGFVRQKKCRFQQQIDATKDTCRLSEHAFREVLAVLIVNAVQAYSSTIRLHTYNESNIEAGNENWIKEAFCLECLDDGEGLVTDNPKEIFEPIYTTKPAKYGTGLGLYIARRIARRGGGHLDYVGQGLREEGCNISFDSSIG